MKNKYKLCFAVILFIIAVFSIYLFAPFEETFEQCLFCGKYKKTICYLGIPVWQKESDNDSSKWILSIYPKHKNHIYVSCSGSVRNKWFGNTECYDAHAAGALQVMAYIDHFGYHKEAKDYLKRWHKIIHLKASDRFDLQNKLNDKVVKSFNKHLKEKK